MLYSVIRKWLRVGVILLKAVTGDHLHPIIQRVRTGSASHYPLGGNVVKNPCRRKTPNHQYRVSKSATGAGGAEWVRSALRARGMHHIAHRGDSFRVSIQARRKPWKN